jgi:hypothetical protein
MQNIGSSGFKINREATFKSQSFDLVAKRKAFEIEKGGTPNPWKPFTYPGGQN